MPLFFVLSGYFSNGKKEPFKKYFIKNARNLLIPYFTFYIITLPLSYYGLYLKGAEGYNSASDFLLKPIFGLFTIESTPYSFNANYALWFFVTLFIVKMIFYVPKIFEVNRWSIFLTCFICIVLLMVIKHFNIYIYGRLDRALMAFPMFAIGYLLHTHTRIISQLTKLSIIQKLVIGLLMYALCYLGVLMNGHISFGGVHFGNSLLLTYAIALVGVFATVCIADTISSNKYFLTIGRRQQSF